MEEKLYFKPSNYGKKQKTQKKPKTKSEPEKPKSEDKKEHKILKLVIFFVCLTIIILIILWLLRGKTTTTGRYPENVRSESLECSTTELSSIYPKLGNFDTPKSHELKITAIFRGEDELTSISLKELLFYPSNHDAIVVEAKAHANFNIGLRTYNYGTEKFDNKFSIIDDRLLFNIYSTASGIDDLSKSYFMINSETLPTSIFDYKTEYEAQGFTCTSTLPSSN